jgi:hypothetical protein
VPIDLLGALAILLGLAGATTLWMGERASLMPVRLTGIAIMAAAIGALLLGASPNDSAKGSIGILGEPETLLDVPGLVAQLDVEPRGGGSGGGGTAPGASSYFSILGETPRPYDFLFTPAPSGPAPTPPPPDPDPDPDPPPTPGNDKPQATNDFDSTQEDASVTIDVLSDDSDPDGDPLSVSNLSNPPHGSVDNNGNGTVTYTPDSQFSGTDSFTYDACDPSGLCDQATVTVTVNAVNDAPDASGDSATTTEDNSVTVNVLANDSDPEGDSLSVSNLSNPPNGSAANNGDGTVTYTPNSDFAGDDSFTYDACDPGGACDTATVSITVTAVNDGPVAGDDFATTNAGESVTITVLGNDFDPDGDSLDVNVLSDPANGSLFQDGNLVTYIPDDGFTGTDSFTYEACDPDGLCSQATVTVTVT